MSKISASTVEYPKRLTAINDVTGALIKSKGTNQEEYSSGWDAIWGKKDEADTPEQEAFKRKLMDRMEPISCYNKMSDGCCHKTVISRCDDCIYKDAE